MATNRREKGVTLRAPVEIQLQPTNRCNADCVFCWLHNNKEDSVELSDKRWLELTDEICALDIPKISICGGGEPLLRPQLVFQIMEKFSEASIEGSLITNGTLITEQLARRMVELQWRSVQVSIHAPTAQLNDTLMGKEGAFNLALRGIGNLNRHKRLLMSALPELAMRIVLTPANIPTLPEFIRLAHSKGISEVFVRRDNSTELTRQGKSAISEEDKALLKSSLERARDVAKKLELRLELEFDTQQLFPQDRSQEKSGNSSGSADNKEVNPHCPLPFNELLIFANGMASPCCDFIRWQFKSSEEREGIIEDIRNQPISQVWREGFSLLRSSMFNKDRLCSTCKVCSMDMQHYRDQWPESLFHREFGHLRKQEKYKVGIQFGLEQLKHYPDNPSLNRCIAEFKKELEKQLQRSAERSARFLHDEFHRLRKQEKYREGIQFGLAQLKEHRDDAGPTAPLQVPLSINLELTNRCNAQCPFCWIHATNTQSSELSDKRWLELADEICQLGADEVTISSGGGEPFMRGRLLMQMLSKLTTSGITGAIITNGTLLTEQFARGIVELKWGSVQVSLHAPTAKLHDEHMGMEGAFRKAMKSIENLNRWKESLGSDAPELMTRIVLTGKNFTHLPAYVRFAKSKGAAKVSVRRIINVVPHLDGSFLIPENKEKQFGKIIRQARQVADEMDIGIEFEFDTRPYFPGDKAGCPGNDPRDKSYCPVPFSELTVFANGTAAPCPNFLSWQFKRSEDLKGIVEDVATEPLSKIWHEGFSGIRSNPVENTASDFPCRRCSVEMEMHTKKGKWPESFFHQRFRHLRKRKEYGEGIRFGLEQLEHYPNNRTLSRHIAEFQERLETQLRVSAEQSTRFLHDEFNNLRKHKRYGEGVKFGLAQLKEHKDSAVLHHYIGEFHMELEEYDKAIEHLSKAVQLDPKMEWTRFSLGKCFYLAGRYEEAEKALKENLELTSERLSHYHTQLFLAMTADARNDKTGCRKALQSLKDFKDFLGNEIPVEQEFLKKMAKRKRLPG